MSSDTKLVGSSTTKYTCIDKSKRCTDFWCTVNCNHDPPNCPERFCEAADVPPGNKTATVESPYCTANVSMYPGYSGNYSHAKGDVVVANVMLPTPLGGSSFGTQFNMSFTGLVPNAAGGFHIHKGVTCDKAGGHYMMKSDPYKGMQYPVSDAWGTSQGSAIVHKMHTLTKINGHAVVLHEPGGRRYACGTLKCHGLQGDKGSRRRRRRKTSKGGKRGKGKLRQKLQWANLDAATYNNADMKAVAECAYSRMLSDAASITTPFCRFLGTNMPVYADGVQCTSEVSVDLILAQNTKSGQYQKLSITFNLDLEESNEELAKVQNSINTIDTTQAYIAAFDAVSREATGTSGVVAPTNSGLTADSAVYSTPSGSSNALSNAMPSVQSILCLLFGLCVFMAQ